MAHQWQDAPLRDAKGVPLSCGHPGCYRNAVRIVAWEAPRHKDFKGQTHHCCSVHSHPTKKEEP